MKAMVLKELTSVKENVTPLELMDLPVPVPREKELLIKVSTCGVCHTELDEIEGRTPPPHLPVVPGHQVVGRVEGIGSQVSGDRVGRRYTGHDCTELHQRDGPKCAGKYYRVQMSYETGR